jgi:hypothetical protein
VELSTELVLAEYLFEAFGNEFRFELEYATTECTQNKGIVSIELSDAVDGADLVKHDLSTFRSETTIVGTIFQIILNARAVSRSE